MIAPDELRTCIETEAGIRIKYTETTTVRDAREHLSDALAAQAYRRPT